MRRDNGTAHLRRQQRIQSAMIDTLEPRRLLAATTSMVKDINPSGNSSPGTATDRILIPFKGVGYFAAEDLTNGRELWRTDGTEAGTYRFADINPGVGDSVPTSFCVCGSLLFFGANDGTTGWELWRTDGTAGGTYRVSDIVPGSGTGSPSNLTAVDNTLFFTATTSSGGKELWKSDGTLAGTVLVKDVNPGAGSSNPSYLTAMNSILYFSADNGTSGAELWRSDGTPGGTYMVHEVTSVPFVGANINGLYVCNNRLYFQGHDGQGIGDGPYVSDGTDAGTFRISYAAEQPTAFVSFGSSVFFSAKDNTNTSRLWKTDGTLAGTARFAPGIADFDRIVAAAPDGSIAYIGTTFFGPPTWSLWRTDGTEAGTVKIHDNFTSVITSAFPTFVGNQLLFGAQDATYGEELWISDGTVAGTHIVVDANPGSGGSIPGQVTVYGSRFYFVAEDVAHGKALWGSDGSTPQIVADPNPNTGFGGSDDVSGLVVMGNQLFFSVNDGTHGRELWQLTLPATPTVAAGPDASIIAGSTFSWSGGSFSDPDVGETWTGSVDYGDASGVQALSLNPDKTFNLSHPYASPGTYTITISVNDGSTIGSDTLGLTVNDPSWLSRGVGASYALTGAPGSPALRVTAGRVSLLSMETFSDVAVDGAAQLDIANHDATISYTTVSPLGSWTGSFYTQLTGLIAAGRVMSSAADGTTAIGIIEQAALHQVRVKYTYSGDATLDGKIDIDDYVKIDGGSASALTGWENGDFNYDGKVNIDDYVLIDAGIQTQGPPL